MSKQSKNSSPLGEVMDHLGQLDDTFKLLKEYTFKSMNQKYDVNEDIFDSILRYDIEDIEKIDVLELRNFLKVFMDDVDKITLDDKTDEEIYTMMKEIKEASLVLLSAELEYKDLKNEANKSLEDFTSKLSSKESTEKRISSLEKDLEEESDEKKKATIKKSIDTLKSTLDLSFFIERISKLGEKEIENIVKGFLDQESGSYIMNKYKNKCKRFKLPDDNFKYFMNIEETFLEEEYAPFNNLFLLMYIRFVAYADPYSRNDNLYVHTLTSRLNDLVYHKFQTQEESDGFKLFIKSVLDNFIEYKELFITNNATYKEHVIRKSYESAKETKNREEIIKELLKFGISYDENMDNESLFEYMIDEKEKMKKKQVEAYREKRDDENCELTDLLDDEEKESLE